MTMCRLQDIAAILNCSQDRLRPVENWVFFFVFLAILLKSGAILVRSTVHGVVCLVPQIIEQSLLRGLEQEPFDVHGELFQKLATSPWSRTLVVAQFLSRQYQLFDVLRCFVATVLVKIHVNTRVLQPFAHFYFFFVSSRNLPSRSSMSNPVWKTVERPLPSSGSVLPNSDLVFEGCYTLRGLF